MLTSTILAYFGSICGTIAVIPQIIRVLKYKDAHALAYSFLFLRLVAFASMMTAVALTKHYWIASSYILIITANIYLLYLKFIYRQQKIGVQHG